MHYWMRLDADFFDRTDVRIIEAMPDGKDILLFFLKLVCVSAGKRGLLNYTDNIPFSPDILAAATKTDVDIVKKAVSALARLKLIGFATDDKLFIEESESLIGCECDSAERTRAWRERKRHTSVTSPSQCDANRHNVTLLYTDYIKEKDENESREKEKETETEKSAVKEIENKKDIYSITDAEKENKEKEEKKRSSYVSGLPLCSANETIGRARTHIDIQEIRSYFSEAHLIISPERFYDEMERREWKTKTGETITDWRSYADLWNRLKNEKIEKERKERDLRQKYGDLFDIIQRGVDNETQI